MAEGALPDAGDAEPRPAVGVGAGDLFVGGHPVIRVRGALLRGKERQKGRERVQGEAPPAVLRKHELLPDHEEVLPLPVIAHHRPPGGDHLDPEVVEGEPPARPVFPAAHLPSSHAPGSGVRGRLRQMTPSARRRSMRASS